MYRKSLSHTNRTEQVNLPERNKLCAVKKSLGGKKAGNNNNEESENQTTPVRKHNTAHQTRDMKKNYACLRELRDSRAASLLAVSTVHETANANNTHRACVYLPTFMLDFISLWLHSLFDQQAALLLLSFFPSVTHNFSRTSTRALTHLIQFNFSRCFDSRSCGNTLLACSTVGIRLMIRIQMLPSGSTLFFFLNKI